MSDLFREEFTISRIEEIGVPLKVSSTAMRLFSLLLVLIVSILVLIIYLGSYSRKTTVTGFLLPTNGLVKIFSPKEGQVIEKKISEGQVVSKDDVLFVLNVGAESLAGSTTQFIEDNIIHRRNLIGEEISRLEIIQTRDANQLDRDISSVKEQSKFMKSELIERENDIQLTQQNVDRQKLLIKKSISSPFLLEQAERNLAASTLLMLEHRRSMLNSENNLRQLESQKRKLSDQHKNELSKLKREFEELNMKLVELEDKRSVVIRAPASGVATRLTAIIGSSVNDQTPMVTIVPEDSNLEAFLYTPSNAVGFVKKGSEVLLSYEAFPHQKFGQQKAFVTTVSQTSVSPKELPFEVASEEPLYVVIAVLDSEEIANDGEIHKLQVGAKFRADLILEKRKIWEWLLGPLIVR